MPGGRCQAAGWGCSSFVFSRARVFFVSEGAKSGKKTMGKNFQIPEPVAVRSIDRETRLPEPSGLTVKTWHGLFPPSLACRVKCGHRRTSPGRVAMRGGEPAAAPFLFVGGP